MIPCSQCTGLACKTFTCSVAYSGRFCQHLQHCVGTLYTFIDRLPPVIQTSVSSCRFVTDDGFHIRLLVSRVTSFVCFATCHASIKKIRSAGSPLTTKVKCSVVSIQHGISR